jgi:hypothetical protein
MSLVFNAGLGAASRQTHALVIGVADYLHLPGGSQYANAAAKNTFGLPRLDSPHVSAVAVANLLRTLSNRQAPIGTIEVVLSPASYTDPQGQQSAVDLATMANITNVFVAWSQRASANSENVAIFFFCGHGFEKEVMILLPADFGNPQVANVALNMIDFTTSRYNNLLECEARTQLYLVDACRENPIDLMKLNVNPTALISTMKTRTPSRDSPVLQSANSGMKAHGAPGQPSYFSQALADCFQKFGARGQNGGVWEVNTGSLSTAMKHYMLRMKVPGVPPLSCDATGQSNFDSLLHSFPGPAYVMSLIDCDPQAALSAALLSVHDGVKAPELRQATPDPWELDLTAGQYDVSATFPGPPYHNKSFKQLMQPPHTPCTLDVQ